MGSLCGCSGGGLVDCVNHLTPEICDGILEAPNPIFGFLSDMTHVTHYLQHLINEFRTSFGTSALLLRPIRSSKTVYEVGAFAKGEAVEIGGSPVASAGAAAAASEVFPPSAALPSKRDILTHGPATIIIIYENYFNFNTDKLIKLLRPYNSHFLVTFR